MTTQTARGAARCGDRRVAQRPVSGLTGSPKRGTNGQKIHRPTMTSSAGSRIIMTSSAHGDARGADRAEAAGGVHLGEQQAQQADDDGGAAGQDRRAARCRACAMASWRSS